MDDIKMNTSIQYQFSNNTIFYEVFCNWNSFNENLNKGPNQMKKYFLEKWIETKKKLENNNKINIQDLNKIVTEEDFDISVNKTKKGITVFFFTFPNHEYRDAASKYVALVLNPKMPRYITLEYAEHAITKESYFVLGEFAIKDNKKVHYNYGPIDNDRLTYFSGYVLGMLNAKEDKNINAV